MLHPTTYPNLELLEYKCRLFLAADEEFKEAAKTAKAKSMHAAISFEATMFPQVWPTTCMGFDVAPDGSPAFAGQAFTAAYTTVFHELLTDTWVVCFSSKPCYKVADANEAFLNDLRNHDMAPYSIAKQRY